MLAVDTQPIWDYTSTESLEVGDSMALSNTATPKYYGMFRDAVIRGEITFGVMISTQFILGMLNGPLIQFINFIVSAQYAKISFLRMNEIRQLEDEEDLLSVSSSTVIPEDRSLRLNNVMFQYAKHLPFVLKNIYLYEK